MNEIAKRDGNRQKRTLQNKINKGGSSHKLDIFKRDIRFLRVKDVKRCYSKLIQDWCKGLIKNEDAKTLAYLLAGYIQTVKQYEIEEKLNQLEKAVKAYDFR